MGKNAQQRRGAKAEKKVLRLNLGEAVNSPSETPGHQKPFNLKRSIDDIAGCFCDPIIVYPSGWGDTLPKALLDDVPMQRLLRNMRALKEDPEALELATDVEVCMYMYTVTLEFPVNEMWVRIYMYVMTRYMGDRFPEDMRVTELDAYDMSHLRDLQRWIVRRQLKVRAERRRTEKVQEVEEKQQPEFTRLSFFDKVEAGHV